MKYSQSPLVDQYISQYDETTKERLNWLRSAIQTTFPKTIEDISYEIPTYRPAPKKRGIIHFGASKYHLGIYGVFEPDTNDPIHIVMQSYRSGKGTLQFKHSEKLPKDDILKILAYHARKINM